MPTNQLKPRSSFRAITPRHDTTTCKLSPSFTTNILRLESTKRSPIGWHRLRGRYVGRTQRHDETRHQESEQPLAVSPAHRTPPLLLALELKPEGSVAHSSLIPEGPVAQSTPPYERIQLEPSSWSPVTSSDSHSPTDSQSADIKQILHRRYACADQPRSPPVTAQQWSTHIQPPVNTPLLLM